jgi:hypothetical protein
MNIRRIFAKCFLYQYRISVLKAPEEATAACNSFQAGRGWIIGTEEPLAKLRILAL